MCDVSPYVQPHDEADVRRADAMTKVDYADARKPSESSERAGEGGKHRRDKEDAAARRSGSDGSDGRRAKVTVKDLVQLLISLSKPPRRKGDAP